MNDNFLMRPKIEIKALKKEFYKPGTKEILEVFNDISLNIIEGDIVSIVGPSGCGKTTLLKIIAGLIEPTGGVIQFNEGPEFEHNDKAIMVFQELHLFDWLTVYQNIEFSFIAKNKDSSIYKKEIGEIIELVGLKDFESYYPHEISGGMRQRLALGRALGASPSVLLLDEPFSSLDTGTKAELEAEFLSLIKSKNVTTILVTHDVRQAIFLGDKVVVLTKRPGKIREVVEITFKQPRDKYLWEDAGFHEMEVSLTKKLKENL